MPVATTKVAPGNCIDPGARTELRPYYPTEIERNSQLCQRDPELKILEDPRYQEVGLGITEYQMMKDSGVLDELTSLKASFVYVEDDDLKDLEH